MAPTISLKPGQSLERRAMEKQGKSASSYWSIACSCNAFLMHPRVCLNSGLAVSLWGTLQAHGMVTSLRPSRNLVWVTTSEVQEKRDGKRNLFPTGCKGDWAWKRGSYTIFHHLNHASDTRFVFPLPQQIPKREG